jgi:eukaryotic-like serine/threonine-protein kinase
MDPDGRPLAGRYRLEEVIGRGGMSTVYRATDDVLGRTVAVKVLLAGLADEDPAYIARFQREARAAAPGDHPTPPRRCTAGPSSPSTTWAWTTMCASS